MLFLVGGAYCLFSICGSYAAEANSVKQPFNAESQLKLLDPFYKQHLVV
jgi:hypothetical protein